MTGGEDAVEQKQERHCRFVDVEVPIEQCNRLLSVKDLRELSPNARRAIGAKQEDFQVIAVTRFVAAGLDVRCTLRSDKRTYWVEWAVYDFGRIVYRRLVPVLERVVFMDIAQTRRGHVELCVRLGDNT